MTKIFVGRRVQPAALTLLLADLLVALTLIPGPPWHSQFHEDHGSTTPNLMDWLLHTGGVAGLVAAVMFAWAWWGRNDRMLDRALQLSTILWLCVAAIGWSNRVQWDRIAFALCFAVLAAGSAWLEESRARCGPQ